MNLPKITKLYTTATHDNWAEGHVDPSWQLAHRDLNYTNQAYNDDDTVARWKSHGLDFKHYTGDLINHNDCPEWAHDLCRGIGLDNVGISLYRMCPGRILPRHSDTYRMYRKVLGINHTRIFRIVVFLEDWQSGHILEVDQQLVAGWHAGDWIGWRYDTPHLAANLGTTDRYTMQITGTYEDTKQQ